MATIRSELEQLGKKVEAAPVKSSPAQRTSTDSSKALPPGVLLDTSDVEQAVAVLERYSYRKERRWWSHNLERLIALARANQDKLESWQNWLKSLDQAAANLRALQDRRTRSSAIDSHVRF